MSPFRYIIAALLFGGVLVHVSDSAAPPEIRAGTSSKNGRTYADGDWALSIDGKPCGRLQAVSGGAIFADVSTKVDHGTIKKHVGQIKYEPVQVEFDLDMAPAMLAWLKESMDGKSVVHNVSITKLDRDSKARSRRDFTNARIIEIEFPAVDAASKESGSIVITLQTEQSTDEPGDDKDTAQTRDRSAPKKWLSSNFHLDIDGLDCSKVRTIDAIKWTALKNAPEGKQSATGGADVSNVSISLAQVGAPTWESWFRDFVIKGQNGDDKERTGKLVYLAPDMKTELGTLTLHNLGIVRCEPHAPGAEGQVATVDVELYCERVEFASPVVK